MRLFLLVLAGTVGVLYLKARQAEPALAYEPMYLSGVMPNTYAGGPIQPTGSMPETFNDLPQTLPPGVEDQFPPSYATALITQSAEGVYTWPHTGEPGMTFDDLMLLL